MSICVVLVLIFRFLAAPSTLAESMEKYPVVRGRVLYAGVPVATTVEIVPADDPESRYQEFDIDYGGVGYRFVVHPGTYRLKYSTPERWLQSEPIEIGEEDVDLDLEVPTNGRRLIAFEWGDEETATFISRLQVGSSNASSLAPARFSYAFGMLWVEVPASLDNVDSEDWIVRGEIFEPFARDFELRGRVGVRTVLPRGAIPVPEDVESGRDELSLRARFPEGPFFSLSVELGTRPSRDTRIHRIDENVRPGWYTPIEASFGGVGSPFSFYSGPPERISVFDEGPSGAELIASPRLVDGLLLAPELPAGRYVLIFDRRTYIDEGGIETDGGFRYVFDLDRDREISRRRPGEARIHVREASGNVLGRCGFRDGDLITHIEGNPVRFEDPEYARRSLIALGTKERVRITIERGERTLDLAVDPVEAFLEGTRWRGRLELHAE